MATVDIALLNIFRQLRISCWIILKLQLKSHPRVLKGNSDLMDLFLMTNNVTKPWILASTGMVSAWPFWCIWYTSLHKEVVNESSFGSVCSVQLPVNPLWHSETLLYSLLVYFREFINTAWLVYYSSKTWQSTSLQLFFICVCWHKDQWPFLNDRVFDSLISVL